MKHYRGLPSQVGAGVVQMAATPEGSWLNLEHHVRHSPDGFSWGYGGSGPSELAKDLLWDVRGSEPDVTTYQQFKWDVIAKFPQDAAWELTEDQVMAWLDAWKEKP